MNYSKKEPVKPCTGAMGRNKQNPMKAKRKMIDPCGNVCWISLATGATIHESQSLYASQILPGKYKAGWVDYDGFDSEDKREAEISRRQGIKTKKNADFKAEGLTDNERYTKQLVDLEKARQSDTLELAAAVERLSEKREETNTPKRGGKR